VGGALLVLLTFPFQAVAQSFPSCPAGTELVAKFENVGGALVFEKPAGNENVVTIESVAKDDENEIVGGTWSSIVGIMALVIKSQTSDTETYDPPIQSGSFDNSGVGNKEISNIQFCSSGECDTPKLGADQVDETAGTVSNTITDLDGIYKFTFSVLDNFTVQSISPAGEYTHSGNTWTFSGSGDPPTSVDFTLEAIESGEATYFLEATDNCPDGKVTTDFDPIFDLRASAEQFGLSPNYPNPFAAQTTIEYALAEQSDVHLSVYDMLGRQVTTLVDGVQMGGTHTITWNGQSESGRSLTSGVYLLRLQAGEQTVTRRISIVR
jgi:hypothetical protein